MDKFWIGFMDVINNEAVGAFVGILTVWGVLVGGGAIIFWFFVIRKK